MGNPFSLVRASDYTDQQINSLWVELGANVIENIISPKSIKSKYIMGGKGSGKTHLLRYYSYPVAKLRSEAADGLSTVKSQEFLAVFIRATGLDSARFELSTNDKNKWQQLFGIYLELRLVESVVDALCDIKKTSSEVFEDKAFLNKVSRDVLDAGVRNCETVEGFRDWIVSKRREIDDAINNSAFSGKLDVHIPFSLGALCLPIGEAIGLWCKDLSGFPVIYLIDEIENFSFHQQQVVNTLVRYGEGKAAFRITGRLYSRKTFSTLADGEENREGAEFETVHLDSFLRNYNDFCDFSKKFVFKRLQSYGVIDSDKEYGPQYDPSQYFYSIDSDDYFKSSLELFGLSKYEQVSHEVFRRALEEGNIFSSDKSESSEKIVEELTHGFPAIIQKLNVLIFCKKYKKGSLPLCLAKKIRKEALEFVEGEKDNRKYYAVTYSHYKYDLFSQICRTEKNVGYVPYAGYEAFVKMSSGNLRNLLIILGRLYSIAEFKGVKFISADRLTVDMQTEAANESAQFLFESDSNFGKDSDLAKNAITRLSELLRAARYALNIPEVSPIAVSFSEFGLTPKAKEVLQSALNYSFVFEISEGRPDRNNQKINRKLQLNPLLSPRWGLPIYRRGDLGLSKEIASSIFDPDAGEDFELMLKKMRKKWNHPFKHISEDFNQGELF